MSKNCWEHGTLIFSAAEFSRFRKTFNALVTNARAEDYANALRLYDALKLKGKGVRNANWPVLFSELAQQTTTTIRFGWDATVKLFAFKVVPTYRVRDQMVYRKVPNTERKYSHEPAFLEQPCAPRKPKRGDFPAVKSSEHQFFVIDDQGYEAATIRFDVKARTVTWWVEENNHAVERARESWLALEFFRLLRDVKWTRGTGGVLTGNDEYNEDTREAGGGANYITARYGPRGEREAELTQGFSVRALAQKRASR